MPQQTAVVEQSLLDLTEKPPLLEQWPWPALKVVASETHRGQFIVRSTSAELPSGFVAHAQLHGYAVAELPLKRLGALRRVVLLEKSTFDPAELYAKEIRFRSKSATN
jgi:hypothetical protein